MDSDSDSDSDLDSKPYHYIYYAQLFPLVHIWIPVQIVSQMVTVPILGMDLCPRDSNPNPSLLVEMSHYTKEIRAILIQGIQKVDIPVFSSNLRYNQHNGGCKGCQGCVPPICPNSFIFMQFLAKFFHC